MNEFDDDTVTLPGDFWKSAILGPDEIIGIPGHPVLRVLESFAEDGYTVCRCHDGKQEVVVRWRPEGE